jgi:mercuric ion binding protein
MEGSVTVLNNNITIYSMLKKIIKSAVIVMLVLFTNSLFAQSKSKAEIKIKTSAECDMCKNTLEKTLAFEKGVKDAKLDLATKEVTVVYNPKKTNPEQLKKAISNAGYDADEVKANNKAFQKLPECCKKGESHEDHK